MLENDKPNFSKSSKAFLSDDLFLLWRISPTHELTEYWENFLRRNPHLENQFQQAILEFDEIRSKTRPLSEAHLEIKKKIGQSLLSLKNKRKSVIYYFSAAVAVAILLIISTIFFINRSNYQSDEILVLGNTVSNNEIQFFLGEEVINLNNNSILNLSDSESSVIIKDSLSQKKIKLQEHSINKLIIPYGKRSSLILADGSKVWLNSGTQIEFPSIFPKTIREIKVIGEIYIEVAKRKESFIVHTPNSQVQVYGTSFNVSAYENDDEESVVLVEGSVQVKSNVSNASVILSPNQIAKIAEGNIKSKTVDISEHVSWKSGFMKLNKVPLDEVLIKIGRYYNIEFRYAANVDLSGKTCSGKLFLSEDLSDILKSFTNMTTLNYEKQPNNIITIKK